MPERLCALDAAFLSTEDHATPRHVGSLAVFERAAGFDFDAVCALIVDKLALLPRYRQRVVQVPGKIARPVWADDVDFDLMYHVRRAALPDPGGDEQLFDLVGRLMSRPLDTSRPLWEVYFVEGLAGGRAALVTKTHQAVVDGVGTVDLGQLILDEAPNGQPMPRERWQPKRTPSSTRLVVDAVAESVTKPAVALERARHAAVSAARLADAVVGVRSAVRTLARRAPPGPLCVQVRSGRVFAGVRTSLDDYRSVRARHGGTVNDVVMATIAGALRGFFAARGHELVPTSVVRALVPMAVADASTGAFSPAGLVGNEVAEHMVDLPIGEADPVMRLQHVGHAMSGHVDSGRSVAAGALLRVGGFAPPTMHTVGVRAAGALRKRSFGLVVTNAPGPQEPMYAAGARMVEMFPIMPLISGHALAVGVTSYNGGVYFGLNGDRRSMADLDVLTQQLTASLAELKGARR